MLSVSRSMSVVCQINCVGGITWLTRMFKVFWGWLTSDTRVIHFLYARALDDEKEAEKKRSLRNEKLKANRTSETEEPREKRLRIDAKKIEREGELGERKGRQTQTITRNSAWPLSKD